MTTRLSLFALLAACLALAGCSGRQEEAPPAPAGEAPVATPLEQARAIASDPRMLLFDLQTALEAVHEASGSYPTTVEFQAADQWLLQRAALTAAFSSWEYVSDGASYQLTGEVEGRRLAIASP